MALSAWRTQPCSASLCPQSLGKQFQQCLALPNMIAFLPAAVINCGTRQGYSRIHKTHGRTFLKPYRWVLVTSHCTQTNLATVSVMWACEQSLDLVLLDQSPENNLHALKIHIKPWYQRCSAFADRPRSHLIWVTTHWWTGVERDTKLI